MLKHRSVKEETVVAYKSLFGSDNAAPAAAPVQSLANMFGGVRDKSSLRDIEDWLKSNSHIKTPPGRIEFILNGVEIKKVSATEVNVIGEHTIGESTMASNCIENVVTEFAQLKPYLEEPKKALLSAVELIEGETKPKGFLSFLRSSKTQALTPAELRQRVKAFADEALAKMRNCVTYRLNPFIEGLGDAIYCIDGIAQDINEAIDSLDYVNQRATDPMVKDLALRRKEMFTKSAVLMQLNKSQLNQMSLTCEKNKAFLTELEMTIVPVLENVMRSAIIDDVSGDGLVDIAAKMRGLL